MIGDFANLSDEKPIKADVCIAGGGMAGIAIALDLAQKAGTDIVVLEGGGEEFSEESQQAYEGRVIGREYFPLDVPRLRFLGGSSNHWGGWCRPLDPIDFQKRPWIDHSGWPFGRSELEPYLTRASDILGIGKPIFELRELIGERHDVLDLDPSKLTTALWRISSDDPLVGGVVRMGEKYRDQLHAAGNIRLFLSANVNGIELADSGDAVRSVTAVDQADRSRKVEARLFVLALGGIENPRLLLNADKQNPRGVGNDYGNVGRYFMEHLRVNAATIVADYDSRFELYAGRNIIDDGARINLGIALSENAQRDRKVLNHSSTLEFNIAKFKGFDALRGIAKSSKNIWSKLGHLIADPDGAIVGVQSRILGRKNIRPGPIDVVTLSEQAPNPASKLTLNDDIDAQGLRRLSLDWRLMEIDKRTILQACLLIAEEAGRLGIGRVKLPEWLYSDDPDDWGDDLEGHYHHMGTTRMSTDRRSGVVDANCQVHGIGNLYIAGSSVFPTGGFSNPTLTVIQLALRLSEHLKNKLVN